MKSVEEKLVEIHQHIAKEKYEMALIDCNELLQKEENNVELLKVRASIYQKKNEFAKAINDYRQILKSEPDNKEIIAMKTLLESILSMTSLDVFECTNTHLDPWD